MDTTNGYDENISHMEMRPQKEFLLSFPRGSLAVQCWNYEVNIVKKPTKHL